MSLTRNQFDILAFLAGHDEVLTQRELALYVKRSLGTVNKIVGELNDLELLLENKITDLGYIALEPYRVKRAVFIAAGFGARMVPITLNTPKPLVRVNGIRIIDTLLDAVVAAGIDEIIIVRGYLGEQFDQLLKKYPSITFLENEKYNEANNISSTLIAKDYLANSYIFEADLVLSNPALITPYQYASNYLGVPVKKTNDWCFTTKNGIITKFAQGGYDCHHMFGVSYWTEKDGIQLGKDVERACQLPGGLERFWDQVPLDYFIKDYKVEVRECTFEDLVEIDTFKELKEIDPTYDV